MGSLTDLSNSQMEDFFYVFQGSTSLKQSIVVWNDVEERIYIKIWKERKSSWLNQVSIPEFIGRATKKTRKTIVVSTMS
jgi:hypothetical protein